MWRSNLTAPFKSSISAEDIKTNVLYSLKFQVDALRTTLESGEGKSPDKNDQRNFGLRMEQIKKEFDNSNTSKTSIQYNKIYIPFEMLDIMIKIMLDLGILPKNILTIQALSAILNNKNFDYNLFDMVEGGLIKFLEDCFDLFRSTDSMEMQRYLMNLFFIVVKRNNQEIFDFFHEKLELPNKFFDYFPIEQEFHFNSMENRLILAKYCSLLVKLNITPMEQFIEDNLFHLLTDIVEYNSLMKNMKNIENLDFFQSNNKLPHYELSINNGNQKQFDIKILEICISSLLKILPENEGLHMMIINEHHLEEHFFPLLFTEVAGKAAVFISQFFETNTGDQIPDLSSIVEISEVICFLLAFVFHSRFTTSRNKQITQTKKPDGDNETEKEEEYQPKSKGAQYMYNRFFSGKPETPEQENYILNLSNTINQQSLVIDLIYLLNTLLNIYEPFAQPLFDRIIDFILFPALSNPDLVPVLMQPLVGNLFVNIIKSFPDAPFPVCVLEFMSSLLELEQSEILPFVQFFIIIADHTAPEDMDKLREILDDAYQDIVEYINEGETDELREACLVLAQKVDWSLPK